MPESIVAPGVGAIITTATLDPPRQIRVHKVTVLQRPGGVKALDISIMRVECFVAGPDVKAGLLRDNLQHALPATVGGIWDCMVCVVFGDVLGTIIGQEVASVPFEPR